MSLKPIILKGEQKRVLFLPATDPIQIKGVAGSGKTTVALYRAKHLLDTYANLFNEAKVAIFTYNKTLVKYINAIAPQISGGYRPDTNEIKPTKAKYSSYAISNKPVEFFCEEISWIKGKAFQSKEEYFDAKRTGRGTSDRVTKSDKEIIWSIFADYNNQLKTNGQVDFDDYALLCLRILDSKPNLEKPFSHIIIDEAQDLSKAQILVISRLVSDETKSISVIADAAQRIYKSGFTWSEVGLNVRGGRTIELKKNYRNTVQIVKAALSLLEKENDKSDFTTVETARSGDEKPIVGYFENKNEQNLYLLKSLNQLKANNNISSTVVLHRSRSGLNEIQSFLEGNGYDRQILLDSGEIDFERESIKICTLSSVKGLEFDNVFIRSE